jgi:hypothetical protein
VAAAQQAVLQRRPSPGFYWNLGLLLALGVGLSGWVLRYTEWFPALGGLLALGGVFSWVAVVAKVLPEDILKALQERSYEVLEHPATRRALVTAAVLLLAAGNFFGGIRIEAAQQAGALSYSIYAQGAAPPDPSPLPPGGTARAAHWTLPWRPRTLAVKVAGFPETEATVKPWASSVVYVPKSLAREVVLVRPSAGLIDTLRNSKLTLEVAIEDSSGKPRCEARVRDYDLRAFWVGGSDDVRVPQWLQDQLRAELPEKENTAYARRWFHPRKLSQSCAQGRLRPGERVVVRLSMQEADQYLPYHTYPITVAALQGPQEFVQLEDLDVAKASP